MNPQAWPVAWRMALYSTVLSLVGYAARRTFGEHATLIGLAWLVLLGPVAMAWRIRRAPAAYVYSRWLPLAVVVFYALLYWIAADLPQPPYRELVLPTAVGLGTSAVVWVLGSRAPARPERASGR